MNLSLLVTFICSVTNNICYIHYLTEPFPQTQNDLSEDLL